jgi:two-component system sensor histidine kinase TctE
MNSLKRKLLALLLPVITGLLCGELWLSYRDLVVSGNSAYDRALDGAIRAIDTNISTEGGGLSVELPYRMLEVFRLTNRGKVSYQVATEDGLMRLGDADLPLPTNLKPDEPVFYDAEYHGRLVRIGAYARTLDRSLYGADNQRIVIQVVDATDSRSGFVRSMLRQSAIMDVLLVFVMAVIMVISVIIALRPLQRLSNEVRSRASDDMTPVDTNKVPLEVRPLVDAINWHVNRFDHLMQSQRRFLEDASHQLRTPLTVLRTQVEYAQREPDIDRIRDALSGMQRGIERSARLVNQLLFLAKAENAGMPVFLEPLNLVHMAEQVGLSLLSEARAKQQDFGLVISDEHIPVMGSETLLIEAIQNIIHNAVRYVPEGGQITVSAMILDGSGCIKVSDNGPGMSPEERAQAGQRFHRGKAARNDSAGLGLAIAKAIAEQHRGHLIVEEGPDHRGLAVSLLLPLLTAGSPLIDEE